MDHKEMKSRVKFWQKYDGMNEIEQCIKKPSYNGTKTQLAIMVLMKHPEIIEDVRIIETELRIGY